MLWFLNKQKNNYLLLKNPTIDFTSRKMASDNRGFKLCFFFLNNYPSCPYIFYEQWKGILKICTNGSDPRFNSYEVSAVDKNILSE